MLTSSSCRVNSSSRSPDVSDATDEAEADTIDDLVVAEGLSMAVAAEPDNGEGDACGAAPTKVKSAKPKISVRIAMML